MSTLREALTATLTAEAFEASYVQAVAGIQITENAYVSPRDDVSRSTVDFLMPDPDAPAETSRAENISHAGVLHTRAPGGRWITIDLPRPALGPLALLTVLYGADLEQHVAGDGSVIEVRISASAAAERVPAELRSTLNDMLAGSGEAGGGPFPELTTARVRIHDTPLHIAEAVLTTQLDDGTATFALEMHPSPARAVDIPAREDGEPA